MKKKASKRKFIRDVTKPLEYQINISFDPRDNIFVANIPELENCRTHGETPEGALANAIEAIQLWLEAAKENGILIPEPVSRRKFSGNFMVRTDRILHGQLAQEAIRTGISMNELASELIAQGLKRTG